MIGSYFSCQETPISMPNIHMNTKLEKLIIFDRAQELKMGVVDFRTPPQRIELGTFFWLSSTLMANI